MANAKSPKHYDEISIKIDSKKGLVVEYLNTKSEKQFTKTVGLTTQAKNSPSDIIHFNGAGTSFHRKTKQQIQKLLSADSFCEIEIKHQPKNKYDKNACIILYRKIKLGYVPRNMNTEILSKAQKKIKYQYYACNLSSFDFEEPSYFFGPLIIGIKQS